MLFQLHSLQSTSFYPVYFKCYIQQVQRTLKSLPYLLRLKYLPYLTVHQIHQTQHLIVHLKYLPYHQTPRHLPNPHQFDQLPIQTVPMQTVSIIGAFTTKTRTI